MFYSYLNAISMYLAISPGVNDTSPSKATSSASIAITSMADSFVDSYDRAMLPIYLKSTCQDANCPLNITAISRAISSHYLPSYVYFAFGNSTSLPNPTEDWVPILTHHFQRYIDVGLGFNVRVVKRRLEVLAAHWDENKSKEVIYNTLDEGTGLEDQGVASATSTQVLGNVQCFLTMQVTPVDPDLEPWQVENLFSFRVRMNANRLVEKGWDYMVGDNEFIEILKRRPEFVDGE